MISERQKQDIGRITADFDMAFTPPGWIYWNEDLYARELDQIFAKTWICVGHVSRLANPGDYFLVNLGVESIIIAADTTLIPIWVTWTCRKRLNDSLLLSSMRSFSRDMPPRLCTAWILLMLSSMAFVVAVPAARLDCSTRRITPERGNVHASEMGISSAEIQMSSGATAP